MEPIRTLLVDDEPLARRRLAQLLSEAPDFTISGECRNGAEALAALQQGPVVDVVFLDVQMPDLSGVQVLRQLEGEGPWPLVVFVTAYDQYTLQAFETHAVDYLLKPIDEERFQGCLAHLRRLLTQRQAAAVAPAEQLLVKQPGHYYFVAAEQVQYLEARGNYVTVHADGRQHQLRATLAQLESRLDPQGFLRVHRSVVVNTRYLKELRPWTRGEYLLTLLDGTHLTSSRGYADNIQRFLKGFAL
ncbi:LytTR family DNA-binding domain-containing protein [Hymenobacter sp. 5516J-16]|uniref:LytR/AlgR family response regulator transcription factor n=1 Tax=Hymenobacter sp. 5516J-16 TaxID=2932253 RepID=UPI001FD5C042|nr:LytTR family DNA-binding domain-containing protein [Hymenobacter sp. 5516J-16]UOQ76573.1 LytTR family DNA-binding domain-containing protein [Hymenobacter sp. 5516J-16]